MTIHLQKGQRIDLNKTAPGLAKVYCGLGWDPVKARGGGLFGMFGTQSPAIDLDASVICLQQGKFQSNSDLIFFNNLSHYSGAIRHFGDNLTGEGEGDDEVIEIILTQVPLHIDRLIVVVNIYDCINRQQHFGLIENAFVRLLNSQTRQELVRFDLSGADYTGMTALLMAELYRHDRTWKMAALGEGITINHLGEILKRFS
ncbi:MAG: TerD family protein [Synechococcaceae cyanobacterium SM2_3_1]|nr:TerD family protein [Synechococcaceae cyanobacterium SM2_3_1]